VGNTDIDIATNVRKLFLCVDGTATVAERDFLLHVPMHMPDGLRVMCDESLHNAGSL
jgi:hypothetical protein